MQVEWRRLENEDAVVITTGEYTGVTLDAIVLQFNDTDFLDKLLAEKSLAELHPYIHKVYEKYKHCRHCLD
ncbi:hypothetical protein C4561_01795 [candidate division WWE3 bacterium]|uniref:Uncharacterized protein n=1 Tax=candidate division WWE3 bacterium TaxID=2053526 RepID=A0A3A4ZF19_UNCKA|nr:MAG: hypothetical protein C4561_01795 [candidate division WWE3 bacterium]